MERVREFQNGRLTVGDGRINGHTHGQSHIQPKQPQVRTEQERESGRMVLL